jgi:hypothetical protein
MRSGWFLRLSYLFLTMAAGARTPGEQTVVVGLEAPHLVPFETLFLARQTVSRIYAAIGIHVEWSNAATTKLWVEFDRSRNFAPPNALGYSRPYGVNGSRIHVLVDRVQRLGDGDLDAAILGHVIAHELGHVLERIARHSESGLMKAPWTSHELAAMHFRFLPFAPEDADLIRAAAVRTEASAPTGDAGIRLPAE